MMQTSHEITNPWHKVVVVRSKGGIENEIQKMDELKAKGLINDSEYSELKAKIIDKY